MCAAALGRGGKSTSSAAGKTVPGDQKPKIDLSNISKPGDVLRAIQQQKEQRETRGGSHNGTSPAQRPALSAAASTASPVVKSAPAAGKPAASSAAAPPQNRAGAASAASASPAGSAPRRIVPQPRQAPQIIAAAPPAPPAIASRPPTGPVIVKPPAAAVAGAPSAVPVKRTHPGSQAGRAIRECRRCFQAVQCCFGRIAHSFSCAFRCSRGVAHRTRRCVAGGSCRGNRLHGRGGERGHTERFGASRQAHDYAADRAASGLQSSRGSGPDSGRNAARKTNFRTATSAGFRRPRRAILWRTPSVRPRRSSGCSSASHAPHAPASHGRARRTSRNAGTARLRSTSSRNWCCSGYCASAARIRSPVARTRAAPRW